MTIIQTKGEFTSYVESDLSGDLINGKKIFFIEDAVSEGITKTSEQKKSRYLCQIVD